MISKVEPFDYQYHGTLPATLTETAPSIIRPKIFTLDNRLIIKAIGKLQQDEQKQISETLNAFS